LFRFGVKRIARKWKLSFTIFLGVFLAASLFAGLNLGVNTLQESLLVEATSDLPADIIWRIPSGWPGDIEVPDSQTIFQWHSSVQALPLVDNTDLIVDHQPLSISVPGDRFYTTAILHNSSVYDEITVVSGAPNLGVNETYIATSSARFNDFPLGSNYTIQFIDRSLDQIIINATLMVVGHIELTEKAKWLLSGSQWYFLDDIEGYPSFFVLDLEHTYLPLLNHYHHQHPEESNIRIRIAVHLDRDRIINPYNVEASITHISQVGSQIQELLPYPESQLENLLWERLYSFQSLMINQRFTFNLLALPVLFVTLYLGVSLGDVTFSLRRREIGLLLAKGGTHRQLSLLFLLEALVLGIVAGILSVFAAVIILPLFIGGETVFALAPIIIGLDTVLLVLTFSTVLAIFSAYFPARKALRTSIAAALREYVLDSESKGYNKKLAWLCLILGTYKLLSWLFSLDVYLIGLTYQSGSLLGYLILDGWRFFDQFLGIIAALLFTYGFIMVLIKGLPQISDWAARLSHRLLGDMGAITAHNIQRRPRQTTAILFIIALLAGFSIQSLGYLISSEDWITRRIYTEVGADISVKVQHPDNITTLLPIIRSVEGIQGATAQFILSMQIEMWTENELRAINPEEWLDVAYYEYGWFPFGTPESTIRSLDDFKNSIVFERSKAIHFQLNIGSTMGLRIWPNRTLQDFTITGFFGPEPLIYSRPGYDHIAAERSWSYTSLAVLEKLGASSGFDSNILIKLDSIAATSEVINQLDSLDGITSITSAIERISEFQTNSLLSSQTNIIRLTVFFALILTVTGTLSMYYLSLHERRRITALMSQRGASYRQLLLIFTGETLLLTSFGLLLGGIVGLIALFGMVKAADNPPSFFYFPQATLVPHHFLPPLYLPVLLSLLALLIGIILLLPILLTFIEVRRTKSDISLLR
jgi:ABC-type antimicrobial peptide transport system permease subunit